MAIPKRGSRNIVVNGEAYRWYMRRRPTQSQSDYMTNTLGLAVEHAEAKGSVLTITLPQQHPNVRPDIPVERPVVPVDVEEYIQTALARGWQPKQPGKTFVLDLTEEE